MNEIDKKQIQPRMLNLLRARTLIYRRAKNYQAIGLVISLGVPLVGLGAAAQLPASTPFIAFLALTFSYLDVLFFDPWLRTQLSIAAKLQEDFDCAVLGMDWNAFLAGSRVDPEQVFEDARRTLSAKDEQRLLDWYPLPVITLPLHLARLICQRTNIWYDSTLRKRYRMILLLGAVTLTLFVVIGALWIDATMTSFVLSALVPMTPIMIWALRERNRHAATCELLDRLNEDVKKLLEKSRAGATEQEISLRSRELQDAIYNHRVSSPLIFDWIYNRLRGRMEECMNASAQELVDQLRLAPTTTVMAARVDKK
jgi:hypothetical protein